MIVKRFTSIIKNIHFKIKKVNESEEIYKSNKSHKTGQASERSLN